MPDSFPATPKIQFRCTRCMQNLAAPQEKAGTKMRCPFCYFDLIVPLESTRKKVKESDLYVVDEEPIDTRDLAHRNRFASFPCPVCLASLAIESESQLGTQIFCPECESPVVVPLSLRESFFQKERKAAEIQKQNSGPAGLYDLTIDESADIYGVADSDDGNFSTDVHPKGTFAVYCELCSTMMYATEKMIGQTLLCPDCGREVLVRKREKLKPKSFQATNFEGGTHYGSQNSPEIFELGKHFPNARLVPVVCTLCETRMYALEADIGKWKTCPDCGTETKIKDVPEEQRILPETTGSEYNVKEPPVAKRPTFRVGVDYRTVEGSLDLEHQRQLQKQREQEETQKKKYRDSQSERLTENAVELIEQKPFSPTAVPGAKPDAYDLQPTVARLIPKPPPLPGVLDSDEPVHVPVGPRPELVHRQNRAEMDDPNRAVALDNVRMKNRRGLSQTEVAAVIYSRPRPPHLPFATRLFRPFFCHDFFQSLLATISIGTLPVAALTYAGPAGFQLFKGGIAGDGAENALQFMALTTAAAVLGSFWISFFVTYLLHFFAASSNGDDELAGQPEYSYIDGLLSTGRLVLISSLAVFPGYLMWLIANLFILDAQGTELTFAAVFKPIANPVSPIDGEIGPARISLLCVTLCLLSHWIFHPLVFLFSCESREKREKEEEREGFFYSSNTLRNLFRNPFLWSVFYGVTFPITAFWACYVYSYFVNGLFLESLFWSGTFFVSFLLVGSVAMAIYFRLLGRLAWVIETEGREQSKSFT
ncbi:MAG: hypothetical protein FWC43_08930 [Planctomycetaceae bacterium]|nr:hypothetical protein [Planctomycetaceae bacterium]